MEYQPIMDLDGNVTYRGWKCLYEAEICSQGYDDYSLEHSCSAEFDDGDRYMFVDVGDKGWRELFNAINKRMDEENNNE